MFARSYRDGAFFFNRNFLLDGENGQNRAGGLGKWLAPFRSVLVGYREIDGEQRAKGRNMGNKVV